MTSYSLWRAGAVPLSLILLLAAICGRAAAQELAVELTSSRETALEDEQLHSQRIDCKLTFDATMDSLEQQQQQQQQQQHNGCNGLQQQPSSTNKPADADNEQALESAQDEQANVLRHSLPGSQPLYELQLVVWPADAGSAAAAGDGSAASTAASTTTMQQQTATAATTEAATAAASTSAATPTLLPLYEDQLVVFPQMDFTEENFDYFFDEPQPGGPSSTPAATPATSTSTSTSTSTTTTTTPQPQSQPQPSSGPDPPQQVYVLENYRIKHANGTEEHKLVLSNGLVNYMKRYVKRVADRLINVQEGYSSLPVAGQKNQIQTLYYIADERGYNVYRIDRGPLPTPLPTRVHYKALKSSEPKPKI